MKSEALTALFSKLAIGVATAATIGGGTALIASANTNAVQDVRIERLEKAGERMDELTEKLDITHRKIDVLSTRLDMEQRYESRNR